ncbi:sulfotransferase 1C2-like protein [Leptotrombidium deliense]|uniref:Sulfotransferase 1C2-like protein n=1 Tax=Leptotrombidium deliense TaxID=299467 RepID=A0A443SR91_9ACAR|nr:sulfotransferase 1C2-like protein [Leptotrombidium deliense]
MAKIDLVDYDGLLMSPSASYDKFKEATSYEPREGDVFVSSYHKCETKRNTKETVLKVAKFLGDSYFNDLNSNEEQMQKLLEYTSFDYMQKLPFVMPKTIDVARKIGFNVGKNIELVNTGDYVNIQFFKSGKTSYTKENYSEQQKAIMKQMIKDHFAQFPHLISIWKQFNVFL